MTSVPKYHAWLYAHNEIAVYVILSCMECHTTGASMHTHTSQLCQLSFSACCPTYIWDNLCYETEGYRSLEVECAISFHGNRQPPISDTSPTRAHTFSAFACYCIPRAHNIKGWNHAVAVCAQHMNIVPVLSWSSSYLKIWYHKTSFNGKCLIHNCELRVFFLNAIR